MGNGLVSRRIVAHGHDTHLGWHAIEIFEPSREELWVIAGPSTVAIAICAKVSVGSGAVSELRKISSSDGN
jgi:ribulose kinase